MKQISREDWKELSRQAHVAVFSEDWNSADERIDFALLTEDEKNGELVQYCTIREAHADTSYISYGGCFPNYRGSIKAHKSFQAILGWLQKNYRYVSFFTENTNFPMLKFGIREGFRIVGIRNFKNKVLLEHFKEREN